MADKNKNKYLTKSLILVLTLIFSSTRQAFAADNVALDMFSRMVDILSNEYVLALGAFILLFMLIYGIISAALTKVPVFNESNTLTKQGRLVALSIGLISDIGIFFGVGGLSDPQSLIDRAPEIMGPFGYVAAWIVSIFMAVLVFFLYKDINTGNAKSKLPKNSQRIGLSILCFGISFWIFGGLMDDPTYRDFGFIFLFIGIITLLISVFSSGNTTKNRSQVNNTQNNQSLSAENPALEAQQDNPQAPENNSHVERTQTENEDDSSDQKTEDEAIENSDQGQETEEQDDENIKDETNVPETEEKHTPEHQSNKDTNIVSDDSQTDLNLKDNKKDDGGNDVKSKIKKEAEKLVEEIKKDSENVGQRSELTKKNLRKDLENVENILASLKEIQTQNQSLHSSENDEKIFEKIKKNIKSIRDDFAKKTRKKTKYIRNERKEFRRLKHLFVKINDLEKRYSGVDEELSISWIKRLLDEYNSFSKESKSKIKKMIEFIEGIELNITNLDKNYDDISKDWKNIIKQIIDPKDAEEFLKDNKKQKDLDDTILHLKTSLDHRKTLITNILKMEDAVTGFDAYLQSITKQFEEALSKLENYDKKSTYDKVLSANLDKINNILYETKEDLSIFKEDAEIEIHTIDLYIYLEKQVTKIADIGYLLEKFKFSDMQNQKELSSDLKEISKINNIMMFMLIRNHWIKFFSENLSFHLDRLVNSKNKEEKLNIFMELMNDKYQDFNTNVEQIYEDLNAITGFYLNYISLLEKLVNNLETYLDSKRYESIKRNIDALMDKQSLDKINPFKFNKSQNNPNVMITKSAENKNIQQILGTSAEDLFEIFLNSIKEDSQIKKNKIKLIVEDDLDSPTEQAAYVDPLEIESGFFAMHLNLSQIFRDSYSKKADNQSKIDESVRVMEHEYTHMLDLKKGTTEHERKKKSARRSNFLDMIRIHNNSPKYNDILNKYEIFTEALESMIDIIIKEGLAEGLTQIKTNKKRGPKEFKRIIEELTPHIDHAIETEKQSNVQYNFGNLKYKYNDPNLTNLYIKPVRERDTIVLKIFYENRDVGKLSQEKLSEIFLKLVFKNNYESAKEGIKITKKYIEDTVTKFITYLDNGTNDDYNYNYLIEDFREYGNKIHTDKRIYALGVTIILTIYNSMDESFKRKNNLKEMDDLLNKKSFEILQIYHRACKKQNIRPLITDRAQLGEKIDNDSEIVLGQYRTRLIKEIKKRKKEIISKK